MPSVEPNIRTVKKTLSAGKGKLPEYETGTKAVFHYECLRPTKWKEGFPESRELYESIDDTRKPWPQGYGKPLELIFGKKFQLPVFETCLRSMLIDEISQFDIDYTELFTYPMVSKKLRDISKAEIHGNHHHETHTCAAAMAQGLGYPELDRLQQEPQPLRFIFHLLEVHQPDEYEAESWQLEPKEKLASVETLREQGNNLFREKKYPEAILKYREALGRVETLLLREKPGDPEWNDLDAKNTSLYLNLSACYLATGAFYEATATAEEVLKRDANNEKALYRRAKANANTWKLKEAEEDLETLLREHPRNENLVKELREEIKRKRAESERTEKGTYKHMFKALGSS